MKRRGMWITGGMAGVVCAVLAGLALAHWGAVRDHAEAQHFLWTRRTLAILPRPDSRGIDREIRAVHFEAGKLLRLLADYSGRPVVYDASEDGSLDSRITLGVPARSVTPETALAILRANGWRVVEQRLPVGRYVVLSPGPTVMYWVGE